jgi:ATP-dependent RNA helicase RhlE
MGRRGKGPQERPLGLSPHHDAATFADFPFSDVLQKNLVEAGYKTPTPIQAKCIGPAIQGHDVLGLAQTGTGKTAAFALPIIHRGSQSLELEALVLAPTRELVQQIVGVFRALGRHTGIRVAQVVGGIDYLVDTKALRSWPNVLVATPGRLIDHIEQKSISLASVQTLVIDEADRMHDMGFIPQIRRIVAALPPKRQTLMFTATMPPDVEQIINRSMNKPVRIQVGLQVPVERATQEIYHVHEESKTDLLRAILRQKDGRVLVFVRTKRGVDKLASRIGRGTGSVARIHGDREQVERDEVMGGFRSGKYRVLIATDIAARGLDVANIEHVINYDFPKAPEDYLHRIGRTARLAASGLATSFVTPADRRYLSDVERQIGSKIPVMKLPGGMTAPSAEAPEEDGHKRHGHGGHTRSGHGRTGHGHGGQHAAGHKTGEKSDQGAQRGSGGRRRRRGGRGRPAAGGGDAGSGGASHGAGGGASHSAGAGSGPGHAHPAKPHGHAHPHGGHSSHGHSAQQG